MPWWIGTRGRRRDYRFLGEQGEPGRFWAPWLALTAPEERTLLVLTDGSGWSLYATAMESGRQDGANPPRAIRNSFVAQGDSSDHGLLGRLVSAWFSGQLAEILAQHIEEGAVDAWLEVAALPAETLAALDVALRMAGEEVAPEARAGTWIGAPGEVAVQTALAAAVCDAASRGVSCVAGQLNLMSEPADALPLAAQATVRIFLLEGAASTLGLVSAGRHSRMQEGPDEPEANPQRAGPSQRTEAGRQRFWSMLLLIWDLVYGLGKRSSGGR